MTFWVGAVRMMAGYGHFLYHETPLLAAVTCKYAIPRYEAIFWQHGMAQVRNNAGDLHRIVIVKS